ncbi:MAG TPA: hypothetical protein VFU02_21280 [Polyangiaceae bacterium]|nr:hypothetical protein [Polyangiaceae bacterium]
MKAAREARWYAPLTHPLTVASFALLLLNDHWLKTDHPGWLSGKLSDVAFMVLAPLWLFSAWSRLTQKRGWSAAARHRALRACVLLIGLTLVLMETTAWGDWLYRYGLGALQFPFRSAATWLVHADWPEFRPVQATRDLTDLFCLPFLIVALWVADEETRHAR